MGKEGIGRREEQADLVQGQHLLPALEDFLTGLQKGSPQESAWQAFCRFYEVKDTHSLEEIAAKIAEEKAKYSRSPEAFSPSIAAFFGEIDKAQRRLLRAARPPARRWEKDQWQVEQPLLLLPTGEPDPRDTRIPRLLHSATGLSARTGVLAGTQSRRVYDELTITGHLVVPDPKELSLENVHHVDDPSLTGLKGRLREAGKPRNVHAIEGRCAAVRQAITAQISNTPEDATWVFFQDNCGAVLPSGMATPTTKVLMHVHRLSPSQTEEGFKAALDRTGIIPFYLTMRDDAQVIWGTAAGTIFKLNNEGKIIVATNNQPSEIVPYPVAIAYWRVGASEPTLETPRDHQFCIEEVRGLWAASIDNSKIIASVRDGGSRFRR